MTVGLRGLPGKIVIVAGAATGIGAAHRQASRCGRVLGCWSVDVAAEAAQQTADAIVAAGGQAVARTFDLADPSSVAALIEFAAATYSGVDAIFNVGADMGCRARRHRHRRHRL